MKITASLRSSVVISAADHPDALNLVLDSIALQTQLPAEVLVVDPTNDSAISSVTTHWSKTMTFPVKYFPGTAETRSRAPLLNAAIRAATSEYLIFLDGDCLPHRRFIADHVRHATVGTVVQGRRARIRAKFVRRLSPGRFHPNLWLLRRRIVGLGKGIRRPWPSLRVNGATSSHSSNFATWRADLVRVNGFEESFDEVGFEGRELIERLRNSGLTLYTITGQAIVYHLDHRRLARYGTGRSERILETTRRERTIRTGNGLLAAPTVTTALANSVTEAVKVA
jgi:hypothetical protein